MAQFVTDAALKSYVAGLLHKDPAGLPGFWDAIISAANTKAYGEIRRRMLGQGYSAAQLAAWDDGVEFELDVGAYWAFVHGALGEAVDDKLIKQLDRREEMASIIVTNAGVQVVPSTIGAAFGVGPLDGSQDVFGVPIDTQDPRIGTPIDW